MLGIVTLGQVHFLFDLESNFKFTFSQFFNCSAIYAFLVSEGNMTEV
jgi:hypothetical protein